MLRWIVALAVGAVAASEAPPMSRVVVALGDSTTAGTPFFQSPVEAPPGGRGDAEAAYPYWLEREMPGWKVLNRGVNGERSDEIRARFERDVLTFRPRFVIVLAGVNDIYQGAAPAATQANLSWVYRRAKEEGIVPVAASVLPFDRATPEQNRRIEELNLWIRREAGRLGIPFCDLHAAAADPADRTRLRGSADGLHPDRATYRSIANAAARTLRGLEKKGRKS